MSLYSRSTTVIHHDSPWIIRHDTLSYLAEKTSKATKLNAFNLTLLCSMTFRGFDSATLEMIRLDFMN